MRGTKVGGGTADPDSRDADEDACADQHPPECHELLTMSSMTKTWFPEDIARRSHTSSTVNDIRDVGRGVLAC